MAFQSRDFNNNLVQSWPLQAFVNSFMPAGAMIPEEDQKFFVALYSHDDKYMPSKIKKLSYSFNSKEVTITVEEK